MNIKQIKETSIYFHDLALAKKFYHNQLGLAIIGELKDKHIFFRAGSSVLLCFNPEDSKLKEHPPAHYAVGKYHFAFEVKSEEYRKHKTEIQNMGIVILDSVIWKNGKESFYFNDPIGNIVEIIPEGIWD